MEGIVPSKDVAGAEETTDPEPLTDRARRMVSLPMFTWASTKASLMGLMFRALEAVESGIQNMIVTFTRGANDSIFYFLLPGKTNVGASVNLQEAWTYVCADTGVCMIMAPESFIKTRRPRNASKVLFLGVRICTTIQVYSADYAVPRLLLQYGQCPGSRENENGLK